MSARIDFYYDIVCPYAYLAHTQIEACAARADATLVWKPILLGGVFKALGGSGDGPMASHSPARAKLNRQDMDRWAEIWEVPLVMPEAHPRRSVRALRAILASDDHVAASKALFAAYWARGEDIAEAGVIERALAEADVTVDLERTADPGIKQALFDRTAEAVAAGAFGVPTFVITRDGEDEPTLIWGQDRLAFVERAARGEKGAVAS